MRTKVEAQMQINKVLVAIDFSSESDLAVRHALNVSRHTGAAIVLAHAYRTANLGYVSAMCTQGAVNQLVAEIQAGAGDKLREFCKQLGDSAIEVSSVLLDEAPDEGIPAEASRQDADLVIVGTHGRTGFKRLLLGSVAERIVRYSATPVMVARPVTFAEGGYRRILVPTDFSEAAEAAVATATALARPGGSVDVLHCWRLPSAIHTAPTADLAGVAADTLRVELAKNTEAMGRELIERYREQCKRVAFNQVEDSAVRGIHERVETGVYDLVVMGSHGRRGLRRWLLGSVAEATVRHSPCSVVVAHGRRDEN
jgi:nucleotide-binding universal stress UspA family protein